MACDRGACELSIEQIMDEPAVPMEPALRDRLGAWRSGRVPRLASGAGHDAAVMASICPTAMLFIRSPGGISHHPDESVRREDVRAALDVMVRFLVGRVGLGRLASRFAASVPED